MAFKAKTSQKQWTKLPTAEEFYDDNQEAFADGDVVMYVHEIVLAERGYQLKAEHCSVFCSYKFWSTAKVIKAYLKTLVDGEDCKPPMVAINPPSRNEYCDWNFGLDEGKDAKTARAVYDPAADDNDTSAWMFPSNVSTVGMPEDWVWLQSETVPNTPASKVAKAEAKASNRARPKTN